MSDETKDWLYPSLFFLISFVLIMIVISTAPKKGEVGCVEYGTIKNIKHFVVYGRINSMVEFEDGTYVQREASQEENCKLYDYIEKEN